MSLYKLLVFFAKRGDNAFMFNDCIIMAGGFGTRLWPASTSVHPKQFLPLPAQETSAACSDGSPEKGMSFFDASLNRALLLTKNSPDANIVVVSGTKHTDAITKACARLSEEERAKVVLIAEPLAKNTAPAIACALFYIDLITKNSERTILVLTSDHIIKPQEVFEDSSIAAAEFAKAGNLVVFGIPPERPETGYGYIEAIGSPKALSEAPAKAPEVFSVTAFREKPDAKTAAQFVQAGNFYWNSGMFAFAKTFMLNEFEKNAHEVTSPFGVLRPPEKHSYSLKEGLKVLENWENLGKAYSETKAISFDYAIAEKCLKTVMVKADFSWIDVGSWDEYSKLSKLNSGEIYGDEASKESCFINSDIPVALCGVKDLIIVVRSGKDGSPPAVLISKKGETQAVREIVQEIKANGRTELL